jgi:hypothetical protein
MIKAPKNIPYFYNRATKHQLSCLKQTLKHFGVNRHHALVSESLLRLGKYVQESDICQLPTDASGKALFRMYKYYHSLIV